MLFNRSSIHTYLQKAPSQKDSFKYIGVGLIAFVVGATCIFTAENFYQPSVRQELFALMGIILCGIGFLLAMAAQLNLITQRILKFFLNE